MLAAEAIDLSHSYGDRTALDRVNLQVAAGGCFALLGPNGGGKTTLFRIFSTLLRPGSGAARILDLDVRTRAREIRRKIGVVFQNPSLDRKLTVGENLLHHGHLFGLQGPALRDRIRDLLERLEIADRTKERVETLSGGLQRRAEIAKALLPAPLLLLLDEPSTGLDPGVRLELRSMLRSSGATVLMTTHFLDEAEEASRVALLDRGRILATGTPDELRREIGGDVVTAVSKSPSTLSDRIRDRLSLSPVVLDGHVRIETPDGQRLANRLIEVFPDEIDSVTVARPTLQDVFIHRTGRRLE